MRFIRWTYVAPRLFAIVVLGVIVHYALDPLLRTAIVASLDGAGVPAQIDSVSSSLLGTHVILQDIRLGHPGDAEREIGHAERMVLDFETGSLLRKRLVVSKAWLQGVRIDVPSNGWQDAAETPETGSPGWLAGLGGSASQAGQASMRDWLSGVEAAIERDLRGHFETVRQVETLSEKWPARIDRIRTEAESVQTAGQQIADRIENASENPLRHLAELQALTQDVDQARRDVEMLLAQLQTITPEWNADQQAVRASLERDKLKVEQQIEMGQISPEALTEYLLRDDVSGRLGTALRWLRVARRIASKAKPPEPERGRGQVIVFQGQPAYPEYLVRTTEVEGIARMDGVPFTITGRVDGITSHPRRHGRPTIAKLTATGPVPFEMLATLDRTGDKPRDEWVLRCDRIEQPQRVLGEGAIAVAVAAGFAEFEGRLVIEDEQVDGEFYLVQNNVQLAPAAPGKDDHVSRSLAPLADVMQEIDAIDARVTLTGTLDEPHWKLESELGGQLAAGLRDALHGELNRHRNEQLAIAQRTLESKMAELSQLISESQSDLSKLVADQQRSLLQYAEAAARHSGLSLPKISRGIESAFPIVR